MTNESTSNKSVQRTTTIKFDSEQDMIDAFAHYGLEVREEVQVTRYFDDDGEVIYDGREVRLLRKHGVQVRTEIDHKWIHPAKYETAAKDYFKMQTCPTIGDRIVIVTTYDLTSRQHQSEVRKILRPLRWAGYKCSYACESAVTANVC